MLKCASLLLILLPSSVYGQTLDTVSIMKELVSVVKTIKNVSYNYTMDISFPNGDKDHLSGAIYLSIDEHIYYNDCAAFTMIYSSQWFYKADHQNRMLNIVDLDKEDNSKNLKRNRENEIFQNTGLNTFLDSILLKKAVIAKYEVRGKVQKVALKFLDNAASVKEMDFEYNAEDNSIISCDMLSLQPWQKTPKGIQSLELKIKFSDFKKMTDKSIYNTDNFFVYKNKKIELKKYNSYKLSTKI